MGSNLFGASLSGMNAAQYGLTTTEHNIANASTPGYNRQVVELAARPGQQTGGGFLGQGVDIVGVKRIYDQFLSTQVQQEQTQATYLTTYHTTLTQIDNLLADPLAGASPAMQQFFDAMNTVANSPESTPARQTMLSGAQFAANRFQSIDQRLTDISDGLNGQITNTVTAINSYAQQIATLNGNIKRATANGLGQMPNDLLDQRDQLVNLLNKEIRATARTQTDGTLAVFIGNGQPMVIDETPFTLRVVQSAADPTKLDVAYQYQGSQSVLTQNSLQGGNLGAFLAFRDQSLEPARNALGRVALGLAESLNQQNQMGIDLNGVAGGALFTVGTPRVNQNANNLGTAVVTATIADVAALTTSDYQFKFDGTNYSILRLSDSVMTNLGAGPGPFTVDGFTVNVTAGALAGDSFLIRPTANGARDIAVAVTDPAKIAAAAPMRASAALTNTGSGTISAGAVVPPLNANVQSPVTLTFNNPPTTYSLTVSNASIAADVPSATPLTVGPTSVVTVASTAAMTVGMPLTGGGFPAGTTIASITNGTTFVAQMPVGGATNPPAPVTGQTLQVGSFPYIPGGVSLTNATVAGTTVTVASTANLVVGAPLSGAGFPAGTTIASITNGTTFVTSAAAVPAAATGQTIQVGNTFNGWVAQISGSPAAGDVFTIGPNTNAAGDNRNALLMAALQNQNVLANGTASFQGAYGQLVSQVGAKTNEMLVTSQAQTSMLNSTIAQQQAVSGVNLDEEAANLLRYQRVYEAAAKAMQIANTMFDTLLNI